MVATMSTNMSITTALEPPLHVEYADKMSAVNATSSAKTNHDELMSGPL